METASLFVVKNLTVSLGSYRDILGVKVIKQYAKRIKLSSNNQMLYMFEGDNNAVSYEHGVNADSTLLIFVKDIEAKIVELKSHQIEFVYQQ